MLFLVYLVAVPARAANRPASSLTLRDAMQAALLHNRALQIERINPEVTRLSLSASYGVYDPLFVAQGRRENVTDSGAFNPLNPAVDTGFNSESAIAGVGLSGLLPSGLTYTLVGSYGHSSGLRNDANFDSYRVGVGIDLQQPLLKDFWIDLPRLTIRINRGNLKISEAGVRFVAMDVIHQVHQAYHELNYAWDNLRVQESLLATREQFLRNVRRQVELGTLTALDETVAAAQRATVQTDLIIASNAVALSGNMLRTLMGTTGSNWNETLLAPGDRAAITAEPLELAASWQRGMAQRPDLTQLAQRLKNAEQNLKYRYNQLFPALNIVGAYGRRGANSAEAFPPAEPDASASAAFDELTRGDQPSDMIGLVFTVPLSRQTERANYRAGRELRKQAELMVKQKEELILREISDALHSVRFSLERIDSARRAVEHAEAALKAEEEKLAGGKSAINFVLQFQADLATARSAEAQALRDHHKAVSQLQFSEGSLLERNQIEFDFR